MDGRKMFINPLTLCCRYKHYPIFLEGQITALKSRCIFSVSGSQTKTDSLYRLSVLIWLFVQRGSKGGKENAPVTRFPVPRFRAPAWCAQRGTQARPANAKIESGHVFFPIEKYRKTECANRQRRVRKMMLQGFAKRIRRADMRIPMGTSMLIDTFLFCPNPNII